jgi:hypothetical protein
MEGREASSRAAAALLTAPMPSGESSTPHTGSPRTTCAGRRVTGLQRIAKRVQIGSTRLLAMAPHLVDRLAWHVCKHIRRLRLEIIVVTRVRTTRRAAPAITRLGGRHLPSCNIGARIRYAYIVH